MCFQWFSHNHRVDIKSSRGSRIITWVPGSYPPGAHLLPVWSWSYPWITKMRSYGHCVFMFVLWGFLLICAYYSRFVRCFIYHVCFMSLAYCYNFRECSRYLSNYVQFVFTCHSVLYIWPPAKTLITYFEDCLVGVVDRFVALSAHRWRRSRIPSAQTKTFWA